MAITKEDFKKQTQEIKRHNDMLYEKFRKDIKIIGDGWDATRKKVDSTFEEVGEIRKDLTKIDLKISRIEKEIELIKLDINFIKTELKKFVRAEEFEALERRVILIEKKLSRV